MTMPRPKFKKDKLGLKYTVMKSRARGLIDEKKQLEKSGDQPNQYGFPIGPSPL